VTSAGRPDDGGAGLVSSVAGVVVFLAFLFFAVQLLYNLYATSVVTATSYDAARDVASRDVDHTNPSSVRAAQHRAERELRARLGRYADRVTLDWSASDASTVRLHVAAENPDLMFHSAGLLGFDEIDRTVTVRVEEVR
jgi:Flp pilus assembly protein TadG